MEKGNYQEHRWVIWVDLKIVNILGRQSGYQKYPCFLAFGIVEPNMNIGQEKNGCRWNICWFGQYNHESLAPRDKIMLPLLHIKLGLKKI